MYNIHSMLLIDDVPVISQVSKRRHQAVLRLVHAPQPQHLRPTCHARMISPATMPRVPCDPATAKAGMVRCADDFISASQQVSQDATATAHSLSFGQDSCIKPFSCNATQLAEATCCAALNLTCPVAVTTAGCTAGVTLVNHI